MELAVQGACAQRLTMTNSHSMVTSPIPGSDAHLHLGGDQAGRGERDLPRDVELVNPPKYRASLPPNGAGTVTGYPTDPRAATIRSVAASGCEIMATCEASTSAMMAPARSAISRSPLGPMV